LSTVSHDATRYISFITRKLVRTRKTPGISRILFTSARGVFPLSLRGEPCGRAQLCADPLAELNRVLIADVHNWKIWICQQIVFCKCRVLRRLNTGVCEKSEVLPIGDFRPAHPKSGELHFVSRLFVFPDAVIPHQECAARYLYHVEKCRLCVPDAECGLLG